ncbi:unnamed protein product, partial [Scytosiphon promiscuus]
ERRKSSHTPGQVGFPHRGIGSTSRGQGDEQATFPPSRFCIQIHAGLIDGIHRATARHLLVCRLSTSSTHSNSARVQN